MKTAKQRMDVANAFATAKISTRINSKKARKANTKASQRRQRMTEMSNEDSEKYFPAPCPTQSSHLIQITTADPLKPTVNDPAFESGQLKLSEKFKLQLFPIDEVTRSILLEANYNPYLELTLRPQKKISSVVRHLSNKWDILRTSSELVLFPYETPKESTVGHRKWTLKDTKTSAADVYISVGNPEVFKLKYGWLPDVESENFQIAPTSFTPMENPQLKERQSIMATNEKMQPCPLITQEFEPGSANVKVDSSSCKPGSSDESVKTVNLGMGTGTLLSWVDCLTSVSIGQLLSETPEANNSNLLPSERNSNFKQIFWNCDSFDAAIADLIARNDGPHYHIQVPPSSIWDAEETRHAFPIQQNNPSMNENATTSGGLSPTQNHASEEPVIDLKSDSQDDACDSPLQPEPQVPHSGMSDLGLSNFCWPDSLGPLEFGISSKQITGGGDSISLSGLIANSLDAFQNCSFLAVEKAPSS